jgi:hypothetical protein
MADQDTHVAVTMLRTSGKGEDSQWFDYRPNYFLDVVRVEWELDTMNVEIDRVAADFLVRHGYAKIRSQEEEDPPAQPSPEPPVEAPQAEEPVSIASSGGKQRKKDRSR